MKKTLYTIGYSHFSLSEFINVLKMHNVNAISDVRSVPYSKYKPDFNKNVLERELKEQGIEYVFMGDYCGAKIKDPNCYVGQRVDYSLVANSDVFKIGIQRIIKGLEKFSIALMCAEKDPIRCHRMILVSKNIKIEHSDIFHIGSKGYLEENLFAEKRLMTLFGLDEPNFLFSEKERVEEAYKKQAMNISFEKEKIGIL
jgi:uncharacterized protein (DUF488 family)